MKKISIALSICVCLAACIFTGCRKDAVSMTQKDPEKSKKTVSRENMNNAGEMHNYVLGEYHAQYGFTTSDLNIAQVREVIKHCAEIAIAAQLINIPLDPDDFADDMIQKKIALGMFDNTGIYKTVPENLALIETEITNSTVRTAIHNINNYNGNTSDFIAYAQAEIAGLQNLNSDEQTMVNGYMSVLSSSFTYWDTHFQALSTGEKAKRIARADAAGFVNGFNEFVGNFGVVVAYHLAWLNAADESGAVRRSL